jgi:hypothetical protein
VFRFAGALALAKRKTLFAPRNTVQTLIGGSQRRRVAFGQLAQCLGSLAAANQTLSEVLIGEGSC